MKPRPPASLLVFLVACGLLRAQVPMSDPWMQVHGADLDANHDGVITLAEMLDDATRGFAVYDRDGNGVISAAELAATGDARVGAEFAGLIFRHFTALDLDGDGQVAREELYTAARYFLTSADANGDGIVSEAEWRVAPNAPLPIPPSARPVTPAAGPGRLVNLATRVMAGGAASTPISGFTIADGGAKQVVVRAAGPALAMFGVATALADPAVAVMSGANLVATNDNWNVSDATAFAAVGAFAFVPGSKDAAVVTTLPSGSYSAPVVASGDSGIALLEIYDADPTATGPAFLNASTRAFVGTGQQVLVAGFTLAGPGTTKLLIRAIGPGLASLGVTDVLGDPQIALLRGTAVVGANDNWSTPASGSGVAANDVATAARQVGAFSLTTGSKDAAVLVTLAAGSYTATVNGADGGTGTALVEIYVVP